MALFKTLNFLPPVFRSVTNKRFLGATLDQLTTDAANIPVNGYIGRTFAPTYRVGDNYVPEFTKDRVTYQLEPSVVVTDKNKNVVFNSSYTDLLQNVSNYGGTNTNHNRLFKEQSYSFDGHFDYDKFVNYNDYYWLPDGPDSVTVTAGATPYNADYTVTRNTSVNGYTFSTLGGHPNSQITLARGGRYTFNINQPGFKFWIQTAPGVDGIDNNVPTVTTRDVLGVQNNGTDNGVIQFNVPAASAQNFYNLMQITTSVDAAVTFSYSEIQNTLLSEFLTNHPEGLDGINNQLQGKTLLFVNNDVDDNLWTPNGIFDYEAFNGANAFDSGGILTGVVPTNLRRGSWKINLVALNDDNNDYIIQLFPVTEVFPQQKVFVTSGNTYASRQFWLNNNKLYAIVPQITAAADYLYYQDDSNPGFVGEIKLVDNTSTPINVNSDIIGSTNYTSPNGVVFTNGLKVQFDSLVVPASYANNEYYVEGVGTAIQLVPVVQLEVPETFGADINTKADYITINRASQDRNPWTRTNRWFHKDVLQATADYNQTTVNYGPNIAGRRAIIEFEPNLQLFNFGKIAKRNISLITFDNTDAFYDIEGSVTYAIDGVVLTTGMRLVFANDYDTNVTNKIWEVDIERINNTNYIRLIETDDDPVLPGENILITQGEIYAGRTFRFDGVDWFECQVKTEFNQAPLFDLVDADGYSFSDTTVYPGTDFTGSRFFGYKVGTGNDDVILGFPLSYQNFNNIGDIVFVNDYDSNTFTHNAGTVNCNSGYIVRNSGLTESTKLNNWVANATITKQYQIVTKFYDNFVLDYNGTNYAFVQLDILPTAQQTVPTLKVFLNNRLLDPNTEYQLVKYGVANVILLTNTPATGDKIDVLVYSNSTSATGYYQIPENLDYNPLNENFESITLGQLRNHYNRLIENTSISPTDSIPVQDRYLKKQGGTLLQHSSPLPYAMTFLNDPSINFIDGIAHARKEYQRFKNKFLGLCMSMNGLNYDDPVTGVDAILQNINAVKNSSFSWFYSDMVPQGAEYSTITYTVLNARQKKYEINSIFNNTELSSRAVLVYHNGVQLTVGQDYNFSLNSPAIVFLINFVVGDVITIRDYASTDGNYIPETPSKLGLYPKFEPAIYTDKSYLEPTDVIRGHDGSITPVFGDFRDQYLLELEKRIFNNIKADYNKNFINPYDTIPGRFRTTDYSRAEWTQLLSQNFLNWVGTNNIDYTTNTWFDANDTWTWNYDKFTDTLDGSFLQGSWRAIYNYWFDTDTPNITPWRMLGLLDEPSWWRSYYGPAPYTAGNQLLWQHLEAGYVYNNGSPYTDNRFARPGLTKFIPVDTAGNLLPPATIGLVKSFNLTSAANNFGVGQEGPAETAWRRSSDYPYALQQAMALARPAEYFATQYDTSRFYVNAVTGQITDSQNRKITPSLMAVNGDTATVPGTVLRTSGYINWIADAIKNLGIEPTSKIEEYFKYFNVQLAYKVAGFTDQNLITVSAEQTSPGSTNASIIIPDENYTVYLGKPIPIKTVTYSAVVVEKTSVGYSISGYDTTDPFFTVLPSIASNQASAITVNQLSVKIYETASKSTTLIPYGTTFSSAQQVADFLISYERYLVSQGFAFDYFDNDLAATRNFRLSINEFLNWAQQGWGEKSIIVLNPVADRLTFMSNGSVIDEISNHANEGTLLDQNYKPIKSNFFNVIREDHPKNNYFQVLILNSSLIGLAKLKLIQYENTLIFDNVDNFGDIIYIPEQGTRQFRLKLTGAKTGGWDGALSAAGYVYNDPIINTWKPGVDYKLGDIVTYNNFFYTATIDIAASQNFNLTDWTQIPESGIQTGLLPSLGHNAQIFHNIYDVDKPPQDENYQIFSAGLIGFRQRPFLSNLGMSIPTQTKFYQGYIKQKGTQNAIDALTSATFNTIKSTISTFEEWAFQVGIYGDVENNQYSEYVLDQSVFLTNPTALTVTDSTYSTANIIVNLSLANVYNASNLAGVSTSIYNNRPQGAIYPSDLLSAGYVNIEDVDYQIFDLTTASKIDNPGFGKKIWAAKSVNDSWNVYRINETNVTAISLNYTLDSYAKLTFNKAHNFSSNEFFILKGFDPKYDGIYRVVNVLTNLTVTIELTNPADLIATSSKATGTGIVYRLGSVVIDSVNDIENIRPLHNWRENDRVWVNNATTTGWGVYTFTRPWAGNAVTRITANTQSDNDQFGISTATNSDNSLFYVGNPGDRSVQVFANVDYTFNADATITSTETGFGSTIDAHGNILVVGSTANVHVYSHTTELQNLVSANISKITSLALSSDKHWLYVGDGIANIVEAYYTADTNTVNYTWVNKISGTAGSSFGNVVKTNSTGTTLFVGAPDADFVYVNTGNVYVYNRTSNAFTLGQTLSSQHKNIDGWFGSSIAVDATADNVFVGVPNSLQSGFPNGLVERWVLSSGSYVFQEALVHPDEAVGSFGSSMSITADAQLLAVGSAGSGAEEDTTFDNNTTVIDTATTQFVEFVTNSGAVYLFEPMINESIIDDVGTYTYTEDVPAQVTGGDKFGVGITATRDLLLIGAPGANNSSGRAYVYTNKTQKRGWNLTRSQQPTVDITSINRTFIYNKTTDNMLAALDFIDPAKGKILNAVAQDIDYHRAQDPALYNVGINSIGDYHWGPDQVGKIWWDIDAVRYINYEQDALIYRLNQWGTTFPGSEIAVYEWVESSVLPSQYTEVIADGEPLHADDSYYSTYGYVDQTGKINVKYYFWVKNKTTINEKANKSNSVYSITSAIENPQNQGIPYATVLRNDTIALYNIKNILTGQNSVLHLGSKSTGAGLIHNEYALVQEGNPISQIPAVILNKLVDSLSGQDLLGNAVPDPALTPAQAYGIQIRPRQSMFINQDLAWSNYLSLINKYLLAYPVIENKILTTLNSGETPPNSRSGEYNESVATREDLSYINTDGLTSGYKIFVATDSSQMSKWSIYEWTGSAWSLSRVQSYKTNLYWSYADWYLEGYNPTSIPDVTVANKLDFGKLTLKADTHVKILNNGEDQFVVYYIDNNLNQNLVGIQNGTIQISTGTIPSREKREIVSAMQNQIFINDLSGEYNTVFFAMIKYALTEQKNLDWVFKTSFLSATQYIRELSQFPLYVADNQEYFRDYINEVKPYRTVVREFVLDYQGQDQYQGDTTDFDLPPYWDANLSIYRSPNGEQSYDSAMLSSGVYSQWNNNYAYQVVDIIIEKPGRGYLFPPQIVITGGDGTGAEGYSIINGAGELTEIVITKSGTGFTSRPEIRIIGSGLEDAVAYAVLRNVYDGNNGGHNVVRSISTTMKFDRVSYNTTTDFVFWSNVTIGTAVPSESILLLSDQPYHFSIPTWDSNVYNTVGELIYFNSNTYSVTGQLDIPATHRWVSNTAYAVNSYVSDSGNTYIVTGNVYATTFPALSGNVVYVENAEAAKFSNVQATGNIAVNTVGSRAYTTIGNTDFPYKNTTQRSAAEFDNANDRIVAYNGNIDLTLTQSGMTYPGVIIDGNTYIGGELDSVIESFYGNVFGINPSEVLIDGGAYVSTFTSHAPEELVPGRMFDSLNLTAYTIYTPSESMAFRLFDDMSGEQKAYRIANANATVLSSNLNLTDTTISVVDASKLPAPSVDLNTPGVIFINGEKITYWTINTTTNTLGQIRRGVDGTYAPRVHVSDSRVVDSSVHQTVPDSEVGNVVVGTDTTYKVVDGVTFGLVLTSNISANVGDIISQVDTYTSDTISTFRVLETVSNVTVVPVISVNGSLVGLPEVFDSDLGFDMAGFDDTTSPILINGVESVSYAVRAYIIGKVSSAGTYTVTSGTRVGFGNLWYTRGLGVPADGTGFVNSTTVQAEFLKDSYGFTPTQGVTP